MPLAVSLLGGQVRPGAKAGTFLPAHLRPALTG
jgi:hypothetical protein